MKKPKISVIVPLYKTEEYLEKCLRSIMTQSFEDIEILCIDDFSPDGSAEIVERLAREDSRITLIRHEQNLGLGGARNTGILAARADYIASVDSDDYVDPDFLERLWLGSQGGYFDVVVCGYCLVDPSGKVLRRSGHNKKKVMDPIPADQNPIRISEPAFWNKLWRRSLFVDNDIWFPNHIYHQDSATTPRIYTRARNICFVGGSSYKYLVRNDSVTQSTSDKHLIDRYRCVDVLKDFFIREGQYDKLKEALEERIYSGYSYHVGNVNQNRHGGDVATDNYLRHLLIMRDAYIEHDMTVRAMTLDEKLDLLINHKPIPRAPTVETSPTPAPANIPLNRPPLPKNPRIMVLTLYSGEHEFEVGCASLKMQTHKNWQHKVFRGLGNQEAHRALYKYIMENRTNFDLFLKLDADMALTRQEVMVDIIQMFLDRPKLDHLVIGCDDYMTGETILGVHTFSNRVTWESNGQGIFNDPSPKRPGTRRIIEQPKIPYFKHASDPSSLQAFHFGAHRALKLVQRNYSTEEKRVEAMNTQWQVLVGVWRQFEKHHDRRHALALVAADLIITGKLGDDAHDYNDAGLLAAYEEYTTYSSDHLWGLVQSHWTSDSSQDQYFRRAVGSNGLQKLGLA